MTMINSTQSIGHDNCSGAVAGPACPSDKVSPRFHLPHSNAEVQNALGGAVISGLRVPPTRWIGSGCQEGARFDHSPDADMRVHRRGPHKPIRDGDDRAGAGGDADYGFVVGRVDT
jgi:hypothetical protein